LADNPDATLLKRRARRRLIGAIALVLFVAIVVPILLDQERKPVTTQELTLQIPGQEAGRFNTRVLPPLSAPPASAEKGETSQPLAGTQAKDVEAVKPEPAKDEPVPSEPKRAEPRQTEPQSAKSVAKAQPSTRSDDEARRAKALLDGQAYVVPLGTFANPDNAKRVQEKATAAGIRSYAENLKGEERRVRAGPFDTREAAEKAREKLKSLGLTVGQVAQR
jgi:DedD protein